MRKIISFLLLLLLYGCFRVDTALETAGSSEAIEELSPVYGEEVAPSEVFFEFEGYGPGKSHIGSFDEIEIALFIKGGEIMGFEGTISVESLFTEIDLLTRHLKEERFFYVEQFPYIRFSSYSIEDREEGKFLSGNLSLRGVERNTTFPVSLTPEGISAEFLLDTSNHGISQTGVSEKVRIKIRFLI